MWCTSVCSLFFHWITSAPLLFLRRWVAFSFQVCSVSKSGISDTLLNPLFSLWYILSEKQVKFLTPQTCFPIHFQHWICVNALGNWGVWGVMRTKNYKFWWFFGMCWPPHWKKSSTVTFQRSKRPWAHIINQVLRHINHFWSFWCQFRTKRAIWGHFGSMLTQNSKVSQTSQLVMSPSNDHSRSRILMEMVESHLLDVKRSFWAIWQVWCLTQYRQVPNQYRFILTQCHAPSPHTSTFLGMASLYFMTEETHNRAN